MIKTFKYRNLTLGLFALGTVGLIVGGATTAFYNDVERSTGNTFTTGGVNLRVDSTSHYNNMICTDMGSSADPRYQWQSESGFTPTPDHYPVVGTACDGTWSETDLEDGVHKFFNFNDLKPGDFGEDTISLHVYDNPAWGRFLLENIIDSDNTCTSPEQSAESGNCVENTGDGEIDNYLTFALWLDQGSIPGFQCGDLSASSNGAKCDTDPTEGDNIRQDTEPVVNNKVLVSQLNAGSLELAPALSSVYQAFSCDVSDGNTDYGVCHGLAEDGRMVPSVTYYFGVAWNLPLSTGNDAQTDTFGADMIFQVEQHRNNPTPFTGNNSLVNSNGTGSTTVSGGTTNSGTGSTTSTTGSGTGSTSPTATLSVSTTTLSGTTTQKINFVATVNADPGFDTSNIVVAVSDGGAGGSFYNGTVSGQCNSNTVDADNEFAISSNKGICYQNTTAGNYTITATLLDSPGGLAVGSPVDISVNVTN